MSLMFYNCKSLTSLPDISGWNINNLIYYKDMFTKCHSSLDIPPNFII